MEDKTTINPPYGFEVVYSDTNTKLYNTLKNGDVLISNTSVTKKSGKPAMSLISPTAMFLLAELLTKGMEKYEKEQWRKGMDWSNLYDATMRHLVRWNNPHESSMDEEMKMSHLVCAFANLMMLIDYEANNVGTDNRYPKVVDKA